MRMDEADEMFAMHAHLFIFLYMCFKNIFLENLFEYQMSIQDCLPFILNLGNNANEFMQLIPKDLRNCAVGGSKYQEWFAKLKNAEVQKYTGKCRT